jgi:transposase
VRTQAADLDRQLLSVVRESAVCRRLMTIPGVGAWIAAALPVR